MGDDWPDLPLLRRAALACAPANAHAEVLVLAHHVTTREPGAGAVRELCDLLLVASGRYAAELETAAR
jgi:3-deoxy-D-manno-octulosonate 8-phosphate phosphatase (KDO 8-P phosphatase)